MLGRSASAAYEPSARLPGTGILLPAWRQLAQLLAALIHEVPSCHLGWHACLHLYTEWLLALHHQAASCTWGESMNIHCEPAQCWTHLYVQTGA